MDRLESIAAFVAVSDQFGFAAAARRLGRSASVVTRQVADLEDRLGVRLLQRTTRAVSLTDAGERFLARARRILADLDDAEQSAQQERATPRGRLSVTAPLMFGRLHVAPALQRFIKQHAGVTAALDLSDRFASLIDEGHDMAIRIGPLADASLVAKRCGETRRAFVASPRYLTGVGAPRHPHELTDYETIAFTAMFGGTEWRFANGVGETRVRVTPRLTTNNVETAINAAIAGFGIAPALFYQVTDAIAAGKLVEVLRPFAGEPLPIHAIYPSSRLLSSKVRAFVDVVAEMEWRFV